MCDAKINKNESKNLEKIVVESWKALPHTKMIFNKTV